MGIGFLGRLPAPGLMRCRHHRTRTAGDTSGCAAPSRLASASIHSARREASRIGRGRAMSSRRATAGLLSTIWKMGASEPAFGPDESLPWSLLPEPPGLTALEAAMGDLEEAMQPSTTIVESVRLLESASLGICDVADRIEAYLPEAEATLTHSLQGRGQDPVSVAAGAAADRMLAGLRRLAAGVAGIRRDARRSRRGRQRRRERTSHSPRRRCRQSEGTHRRSVLTPPSLYRPQRRYTPTALAH